MKSRNLFLGIIILFIGVVALLASLGTISFSWQIALRLWPLLLIFLGIAILPVKDLMKAILLLVTLGAGVLLYQNEAKNHPERNDWFNNSSWNWYDDDDDNDADNEFDEGPYSQQFSEPYEAFTKATLNIDFGAGELEIGNPSAELIKVIRKAISQNTISAWRNSTKKPMCSSREKARRKTSTAEPKTNFMSP